MKKYVILPSCSDLNRGDQALVWQSKQIAEEAGYLGEYYILTEHANEQSDREGIKSLPVILRHPSRYKNLNKNINYNILIKIRWGFVALLDLFFSVNLLWAFTRPLFRHFLGKRKETLSILEESEAVMVKGGGFVHSYGGNTSLYYIYYILYHVMLAQSIGKRIFFLPNSFGPFIGFGVKPLIKKVLKKCIFISSRESISTDMLKNYLGIDVETYPDLAFGLKLKSGVVIDKKVFNSINRIPNGYKTIALTMRPYRFPENEDPQEAYRNYKDSLHEFLNWLYSEKYLPIIVEHTLSTHEHENDGQCIKEVLNSIPEEHFRLLADKRFDCRDLKEIYGNCDYIVGTRFHSIIFSISQEVPAIAITYGGNKGQGIMRDMGLSEYCLEIDQVSFRQLKDKFIKLLTNEEDVRKSIKKYLLVVEQKYKQLVKKLAEDQHE